MKKLLIGLLLSATTFAEFSLSGIPYVAPGTNGNCLVSNGSIWTSTTCGGGGGISALGAIGSSPNANGATISGGTTLNLEPASASFGGVVTTAAQDFAGNKTFSGFVTQGTATNFVRLYSGGGVAAVRMNSATTRYTDWYRFTDNFQYLADDTNGDRIGFGMNGNVVAMQIYGASGRHVKWVTDGSGGLGSGAASERPDHAYIKTRVGIGLSTTQEASAQLQGDSTTQGWLPPRMTSTQRDAITPAAGLIIYNTTTSKHEGYNGTWNAFY